MRTCEKNKVAVWYTNGYETVREKDENGYYTGEFVKTYQVAKPIKINMYPVGGSISNEAFGDNCNFDMMCVEIGNIFNKDTLIFLQEPVGDYEKVFDYSVSQIKESINSTYYGLKRRV